MQLLVKTCKYMIKPYELHLNFVCFRELFLPFIDFHYTKDRYGKEYSQGQFKGKLNY